MKNGGDLFEIWNDSIDEHGKLTIARDCRHVIYVEIDSRTFILWTTTEITLLLKPPLLWRAVSLKEAQNFSRNWVQTQIYTGILRSNSPVSIATELQFQQHSLYCAQTCIRSTYTSVSFRSRANPRIRLSLKSICGLGTTKRISSNFHKFSSRPDFLEDLVRTCRPLRSTIEVTL